MVLNDLNVDATYALSPQARGKIERPYQWLQDRIVRNCAREKITVVEGAQKVLEEEAERQATIRFIQLPERSLSFGLKEQ